MKINNLTNITTGVKPLLAVGQVWMDTTNGTPYMITGSYGLASLKSGYYYGNVANDDINDVFGADERDFILVEGELTITRPQ